MPPTPPPARRPRLPRAIGLLVATCVSCGVTFGAVSLLSPKRRPAERPIVAERQAPAEAYALPLPQGSSKPTREPPPVGPGKVREGPPEARGLDHRRTNRSPFAAPKSPRLAFTFDTGGPIAAPPIVAARRIVVASLSGKVVAMSFTGKLAWHTDLGERIYGSPFSLGEAVLVGIDKGKLVSLSSEDGARRKTLDVDGDADTSIARGPSGTMALAAGKTLYLLGPDLTIKGRYKARSKIFSSPAIGDDGAIYFGSQDDHLYGLGPDLSPRFRVRTGGDADASPAIGDDGAIYFGDDGGEVVAVEPSGHVRFRAQLGGYVRGPLSIARDGTVLASTYGPSPAVVGLSPDRGDERFRFDIRGRGHREFGVHGAPLEDRDGVLLFGGQDDVVYAIDQGGNVRYRLAVGGDVDGAIALVADGVLAAGCEDGKLYVFVDADAPRDAPP